MRSSDLIFFCLEFAGDGSLGSVPRNVILNVVKNLSAKQGELLCFTQDNVIERLACRIAVIIVLCTF